MMPLYGLARRCRASINIFYTLFIDIILEGITRHDTPPGEISQSRKDYAPEAPRSPR